jgi:hypothetical protein
MAFQDTLKLNSAMVEGPAFRRIAEHHLAEDSGHDVWFLCDMIRLGEGVPDLQSVFSNDHQRTREATYRILGEIFRAESDLERVTLILTLEAAGHHFFGAVAQFAESDPSLAGLQYLSEAHLSEEKNHEMFEAETQQMLLNMYVPSDVRSRCLKLVGRVFDAFGDATDKAVQCLPHRFGHTGLPGGSIANLLRARSIGATTYVKAVVGARYATNYGAREIRPLGHDHSSNRVPQAMQASPVRP